MSITMIEAAVAASIDNLVANSLEFTQTSGFDKVIMDPSLTYANPDPPRTGATVFFNLGGIWT